MLWLIQKLITPLAAFACPAETHATACKMPAQRKAAIHKGHYTQVRLQFVWRMGMRKITKQLVHGARWCLARFSWCSFLFVRRAKAAFANLVWLISAWRHLNITSMFPPDLVPDLNILCSCRGPLPWFDAASVLCESFLTEHWGSLPETPCRMPLSKGVNGYKLFNERAAIKVVLTAACSNTDQSRANK